MGNKIYIEDYPFLITDGEAKFIYRQGKFVGFDGFAENEWFTFSPDGKLAVRNLCGDLIPMDKGLEEWFDNLPEDDDL
jgi:hypothetical protein